MALNNSPGFKDGVCPVCGSTRVKSGEDIPDKEGLRGSNRLPINAVFSAPLDNFVCLECGYVETYILDRSILNRIAREWLQVPVQDTDNLTKEHTENENS